MGIRIIYTINNWFHDSWRLIDYDDSFAWLTIYSTEIQPERLASSRWWGNYNMRTSRSNEYSALVRSIIFWSSAFYDRSTLSPVRWHLLIHPHTPHGMHHRWGCGIYASAPSTGQKPARLSQTNAFWKWEIMRHLISLWSKSCLALIVLIDYDRAVFNEMLHWSLRVSEAKTNEYVNAYENPSNQLGRPSKGIDFELTPKLLSRQ